MKDEDIVALGYKKEYTHETQIRKYGKIWGKVIFKLVLNTGTGICSMIVRDRESYLVKNHVANVYDTNDIAFAEEKINEMYENFT